METMENAKKDTFLKKVGTKAKNAGSKVLIWVSDHPYVSAVVYASAVVGGVSCSAIGLLYLYKHNGANKMSDDWQMCVYRSEPGTKFWKYQRKSPVFHPSKEDAETILEFSKDWKDIVK